MTQSNFAERNKAIYEWANKAGRSQGVMAKIAEHFGLTRQRVSAIIQRQDKLENAKPAHEPFDQIMGAWCASETQRAAFDQFCLANNMNRAAAMRQAVDLLLETREFEGKEENEAPFDKPLGPWKTTKAQRDAFAALLEEKKLKHASGMRMAIQLLLSKYNQ